MKLTQLITINAIVAIGFGIAFGLYGPLMMAFFAIPEALDTGALAYWNLAAFVRLFGAALFGYGLLLWSLRGIITDATPEARRGILFALFLGHMMSAVVSVTQQFIVWQSNAGWITTGVFVVLLLVYGYFLFVKTG